MNDTNGTLIKLRPSQIIPSPLQPRKRFPSKSVKDMGKSVWQHGVIEPIKVRLRGDFYELIYGERRWRGATAAEEGIDPAHPAKEILIDAIVEEMDDLTVLRLQVIENVERESLTPVEEAQAYARMRDLGESLRDIASKSNGVISKDRVHRMLRLLEIPEDWQKRINSGNVPLYVADEALRVPEEQREKALEIAMAAGSRDSAREKIRNKLLRPSEERAAWKAKQKELKEGGDEIEILDYDTCREIFPFDVNILGTIGKASAFARADEMPHASDLAPGKVPDLTWRDLCLTYEVPLFAAIDGRMEVRFLARKSLVKDAAAAYHSGLPCSHCKGKGVVDAPDFDGDQACPECPESPGWERSPNPELNPFPDDSPEGRRAQRGEAELAEAQEVLERDRRAERMVRMISALEVAVRAVAGQDDKWLIEGSKMLFDCGLLGVNDKDNPATLLLLALERRPAANSLPLSRWEGLNGDRKTRAGLESFAVCSLALYWLDRWEGDDLAQCPTWQAIAAAYKVTIPGE